MANYYRVNLKDKNNNIIYPNIHYKTHFNKSGYLVFGKKISFITGVEDDGTTYGMIGHNGTNLWIGADSTAGTHHSGATFISTGEQENLNVSKLVNGTRNNYIVLDQHNYGNYALKLSGGTLTGHLYLNGIVSGTPDSTTKIIFGNTTNQYVVLRANTGGSFVIADHLTDNTNGICFNGPAKNLYPLTSNHVTLGDSSHRWSYVYGVQGNFSNQIQASVSSTYRIALGGGDSYVWIDCRDSSNTMKCNITLTPSIINLYKNTYIGGSLTLTDNIKITRHDSTQIPLKVYGGDANGQGISVGAGGATIIGSGESAKTAEASLAATTETMWMLSDTNIQFTTNCQTWDSRVSVYLDTGRNFYPASTNSGSLGTSSYRWNNVYANYLRGQLYKMDTFYNAGTAGISYYDADFANVSTSASTNGWTGPSAAWYQVIHLDLSVDNYYNDLYFPVNSRECIYWRQRCNGGYYGFFSIPASWDKSVRNFRAGTKATWDSNYSGYVNGTVMFCW